MIKTMKIKKNIDLKYSIHNNKICIDWRKMTFLERFYIAYKIIFGKKIVIYGKSVFKTK